jgi:type I restriction enzyme M protein
MPRYVDTFEEESEINLGAVMQEIANLESQLTTVRAKMKNHLQELGL